MKHPKVNIDNATKCLCPVCPVQVPSPCVAQRRQEEWDAVRRDVIGGILAEYAEHPETYEMEYDELKDTGVGRQHEAQRLSEAGMIELYCSIGMSSCPDLVTSEACVCPDCLVWQRHGLSERKYCIKGSVESLEDDQ